MSTSNWGYDQIAKNEDIAELNDPKYKIGVKLGTTNDFFAVKNLNKAFIHKFNEYDDIVNAVRNNKVDLIITDLTYGISIERISLKGAL